MTAVLTLIVVAGLIAGAGWLVWAGTFDGISERARDGVAGLYPRRPLTGRTLPRKLLRAAERTVSVGVTGAGLLPTRIEVAVHPDDLAVFADAVEWLERDIAEALRHHALAKGWVVPSGPRVVITPDEDRPLRAPRAMGYIGALGQEHLQTLYPPQRAVPPMPVIVPPHERTVEQAVPPPDLIPEPIPEPTDVHRAPAAHVRLVVVSAGDGGAEDADLNAVLVGGQSLVLGRSRQADLRVKDDSVSGRHCRFTLVPPGPGAAPMGTVMVEDLQSTNGTYVDGNKVGAAVPLGPGSTLEVGGITWRVETDGLG